MHVTSIVLSTLLIASAAAAGDRPNIVYIMVDDAGYGDFGCYGQTKFATPNIDRLAAEGMRFTQHYSGSTVCAPTRCSLMTGLHTGHCVVRGNKRATPLGQMPVPAEEVFVSEMLRDAGYATGAFGKWGLGPPESEGDPLRQGFDAFYGYNCQRNAHTYYPTWLFDADERVELDGKTYAHDLIMDEALEFIRVHRDGPFFCYVPMTIPHAAMQVPESYMAPFRDAFPEFEDTIGRYANTQTRNPIAAFAGMMTKMDEDVGRIMTLLAELEIDDETVVMFTSDNGPHKEGGHDPKFFDSNGPLTGHKRTLTDGGIRVPLIVRWPGRVEAGTTSAHVSAHWDFMATACEIAGIDAPSVTDGISFVPALLQQGKQRQHDYLYWEFYEQGGKRAVRMGRWKAIQRNLHKNAEAPILLYDITTDIGEQNDVATMHPDVIERVRAIFDEASTPSAIWSFKALEGDTATR